MAIPFLRPTFPPAEMVLEDYRRIVERGIYSNHGPVQRTFADALGQWIGQRSRVLPIASGTAGLELTIRAAFDPDRDQVLVASFTFAATAQAIRNSGYKPVFMDVAVDTWQPSYTQAASYLGKHEQAVAGILLTNTFGVANAEIGEWERLSEQFGLPLVIDSAAGFGASYPWGESLGGRGLCEVFSFHATKTLAIGEGGAVSSRDPAFIERISRMANFGFNDSRVAEIQGTNAKLSELACAIGLRQLEALERRLELRRQILGWYRQGLEPLGWTFQPGASESALPFVSVASDDPSSRSAFFSLLDKQQIEYRDYYNPPLHRHPAFLDCDSVGDLSITEELAGRVTSLPMYDDLPKDDVLGIIHAAELVFGERCPR